MTKQTYLRCCLWTLLCACALVTLSVSAAQDAEPTAGCSADERAAFLDAANNGVPAEDLVQIYAHCAADTTTNTGLTEPGEKIITINNGLASTFYEQMNGCGYHPQIGVAVCDVEIKQPFGFGPFGPNPLGSTEFVDFCFRCAAGSFQTQGTVHVTNDTTGVTPSWGMMAFGIIPPGCGYPAGTGAPIQVRATLSWGVPAINPCSNAPIMVWGNQISFDTRDDP